MLALALTASADVTPTIWWKSYYGDVMYNGQPAPKGSIIDAYDPDGVHCGTFTVGANYDTVGAYGMLFVYRDDPYSPDFDEGANAGDLIAFNVNHRDAQAAVDSGDIYWEDMAQAEVDLSVDDAIIALTMTDPPVDRIGKPNSIVRVQIGVRNDGNGLDFYSVEATGSVPPTGSPLSDWAVVPNLDFTYAASGEVVYAYFDVELPLWPGTDTLNTIDFAVYSNLDPTQRVEGSMQIRWTPIDQDIYAIHLADPPLAKQGEPEDMVQFTVGVRNVGNMADEYYIDVISYLGWDVSTDTKGSVTAQPGELVYLAFEVTIPITAGEGETDILSYTVTSFGDPSVSVGDEVLLTSEPLLDVGDDVVGLLPNSLHLAQNYPNPFNPTTTIAFTLPSRSQVNLEIIDILGRTIDRLDLGALSNGSHSVEYDGSSLASGVYFYRLVTESGHETRKMVLLK